MGSGTKMPWFKFQLCHLLSVFLRFNLCVLLTVPICKRRIRIHLRGGVGKYREKKKITPFVPNCIYSGFFLWLVGWFWSPPPEGEETKYISVILKMGSGARLPGFKYGSNVDSLHDFGRSDSGMVQKIVPQSPL